MQSHIFELGLINGQCSDVSLRAFGRVYSLHRLFLIQSGFFRAMLCGGYAEDVAVSAAVSAARRNLLASHSRRSSTVSYGTVSAADEEGETIDLHFDDPNISRSAFEYCIAHLYGGGPKLILPHWANPSSSHPLSPAFTLEFDEIQNSESYQNEPIGSDSHPATPRFLLSVLATSIYLNIPSITSQALTLILCSVTPYTVSHYLRFAIGKGIEGATFDVAGSSEDSIQWDWEMEGPARTLEGLGKSNTKPFRGREPFVSADKQGSKSGSEKQKPHSPGSSEEQELLARTNKLNLSQRDEVPSGAGLKRNRDSFGGDEGKDDGSISSSPSSGRGKSASLSRQRSFEPQGSSEGPRGEHTPTASMLATTLTPGQGVSPRKARSKSGASRQDEYLQQPDFHYGTPADKIGEACACWYSRWGYDVFEAEDVADEVRAEEVRSFLKAFKRDGTSGKLASCQGRFRSGDVDLPSNSFLPFGEMPDPEVPLPVPHLRVWSYPAMPSSWVRAIISSDCFFVRSEWDRYTFAKRVVEMRRLQKERIDAIEEFIREETANDEADDGQSVNMSDGEVSPSPMPATFGFRDFGFKNQGLPERRDDQESFGSASRKPRRSQATDDSVSANQADTDEDEAEYTELFSSGVYYTHMSFQELNRISTDLSPINGKPYSPLAVLQAALWAGSELKNHVISSMRGARAPSLPAWDAESEEFDGSTGNNSLESSGSGPVPSGSDTRSELGISSSLMEFRQACESANASPSSQLFGRSRSSTPFDATSGGLGGGLLNIGASPARSLGGIGVSPLSLGSGGGRIAQLKKRYYPVASDDTVRYGDGLSAIYGQTAGTGGGGQQSELGENGKDAASSYAAYSLGATGNAVSQLLNTVPLPAPTQIGDALLSSATKRDRQNFFGIANSVATGRELGTRTLQESRKASRRSRTDCEETPSLSQFGGLPPEDESATSAKAGGEGAVERWTGYEPMRLGVEFFGVDKLQEKQRLYSPTFFYAGSIWNLYVQVVKKAKGIQLGVYLHRQSPNESLPQPSAPEPAENSDAGGRRSQFAASRFYSVPPAAPDATDAAAFSSSLGATLNLSTGRDGSSSFLDPGLNSTPARGGSNSVQPSPARDSMGSTLTLPTGSSHTMVEGGQIPIVPLSPGGPPVYQVCPTPSIAYRDTRKVLRAYFTIHCPSPLGNALTRFSSAPDYFTLSQSWGWKSSSLLGISYLENGKLDEGKNQSWNRFKCVCTIGVV